MGKTKEQLLEERRLYYRENLSSLGLSPNLSGKQKKHGNRFIRDYERKLKGKPRPRVGR